MTHDLSTRVARRSRVVKPVASLPSRRAAKLAVTAHGLAGMLTSVVGAFEKEGGYGNVASYFREAAKVARELAAESERQMRALERVAGPVEQVGIVTAARTAEVDINRRLRLVAR